MADVTSIYGNPIKDAVARADISTLQTDVQDVKDGLQTVQTEVAATLITDTASGAIASFPDGADGVPVKALAVNIEPVQDLHGQDAPYPSGGGVNKLPPMVDGTYTGNGVTAVVKDGIATLSGTTTAAGNALIIPLADTVTVPEGYMHTMNSVANGSCEPSFENSSDVGGTVLSFSLATANRIAAINSNRVGKTWNRIRFYLASGITLSGTFAPMVIADNTARSAYIPYSNICPISGHTSAVVTRTGKNLLVNASDSYTIANAQYHDYTVADASALLGQTLTFSIYGSLASGKKINIYSKGTNVDVIKNGEINAKSITFQFPSTIPDGFQALRIYIADYTGTESVIGSAQLELGSTSTAHEPYTANTYTIALGGTVYGGTLDVTAGMLTVDRVYRELSSNIPWQKSSSYPGGFYSPKANFAVDGHEIKASTPFMCSHAKSVTALSQYVFGTCFMDGSVNIRIMEANTTVAQWGEYLDAQITAETPVSCCFELAEPFEVQLTAQDITTLKGQNNIWSDTGDVEVEYRADTKLYINKVLNA